MRDTSKDRGLPLPPRCFTDDPGEVVGDPEVDIVVEVMSNQAAARSHRRSVDGWQARRHREQGASSRATAASCSRTAEGAGVDILFEASVGGGIPLIRPFRESLAGDRIRVMGIVNGTTNYILTRMADAGATFSDALDEAQRLGSRSPTRPPTSTGSNAAAKAAIIASIAFSTAWSPPTCTTRGSVDITADDIQSAADLGYVVKLLAVAEDLDGEVAVRVHPAMVPLRHPLASVRDSFNTVFIEGDTVGELMLYGHGAGGARPRRRCSATWSMRPRTWSRAGRAPRWARWPPSRSGRSTRSSRSSIFCSKSPTARECSRRSRPSSVVTVCRSGRCSSGGSVTMRASSS